jgi:hypothetical protein
MSTISALKVFSLFGKRRSCSEVTANPASFEAVSARAVMGDKIPATQPSWLQTILDGHQREIDACKNTNDTFLNKFDVLVSGFSGFGWALIGLTYVALVVLL